MLKTTLLTILIVSSIFFIGCDSNHSPNLSPTVFSELAVPTNAVDIQTWLNQMPVQASALKSKVLSSTSLTWEQDILPVYDLIKQLNINKTYSGLLLNRSHDPNIRTLGYTGFQQIPVIESSIKDDQKLKAKIMEALDVLSINNPKQRDAANYFNSIYSTKLTSTELKLLSQVNNELTTTSLAFYTNASTKSFVTTFSQMDFSCLSSKLKSKFSTNSANDYIFDANHAYQVNLLRSCLPEPIREKISATTRSKASKENSLLTPYILKKRLEWAKIQGYDDFASARLSRTILATTTDVKSFLAEVNYGTNPAMVRLKNRFKDLQMSETGVRPTTVFDWTYRRYYSDVRSQLHTGVSTTPIVFQYPETVDRMLDLLGKVVGVNLVKTGVAKTKWSSYIIEYKLYDTDLNTPIGILLLDPYKVENTNSTPATVVIQQGRVLESGIIKTPIITVSMPLKQSSQSFTSYDYESFAHEFGHAFHMFLRPYNQSSKHDFQETPSAFFEEIASHPSFFKSILSTNPDIPLTSLPNVFASRWNYERQDPLYISDNIQSTLSLSQTALDIATWTSGSSTDFSEIFKENSKKYRFQYSNLAKPGYDLGYFVNPNTDATYYLYVLGKVLAKDMMSIFEASPDKVFDKNIGRQYRKYILEETSPNTQKSIESFLGRKWSTNSYKVWFENATKDL
ncbi:MAG: hypothetical protein KC646_10535 [Candidatus Cloacimonetes bacterium]|nr:hypothetical protein [Candidatus Cloacimonadota bacterium]